MPNSSPVRRNRFLLVFPGLFAASLASVPALAQTSKSTAQSTVATEWETIPETVQQQIRVLSERKVSLTPLQAKLGSKLSLIADQQANRPLPPTLAQLRPKVKQDEQKRLLVDITGNVTNELVATVVSLGGEVLSASVTHNTIHAYLPASGLEPLAARADVRNIRPALPPVVFSKSKPKPMVPFRAALQGSTVSEAVVTHAVNTVRNNFGLTGTGVRIGVISDSDRHREQSIASGNLPVNTVTLPGQSGRQANNSDSGEGTAMMELIHDMVPGAELYFATAIGGETVFANNILALANAGCDIIVDDIAYLGEPAFQDGLIAQAVNEVTRRGVLYLSSAGNFGNLNDSTASTWEGDYQFSGTRFTDRFGDSLEVHRFTSQNFNRFTGGNEIVVLQWSDRFGFSANDYELYEVNASNQIVDFSDSEQDGNDIPIEFIEDVISGNRLLVLRFSGQPRYLRLSATGRRLDVRTASTIFGHNGGRNTVSVAATPARQAFGLPGSPTGPWPGVFNATNRSEVFTSDGPRRIFYNPDGSAITPDNFLAATNGGEVLLKPELTAADGTVTTVPGFSRFYGTSAAAPNAAAIAALALQYRPLLTVDELKTALAASCIDIEATGFDRDTGNGILMADRLIAFLNSFFNASSVGTTNITANSATVVWRTNLPANARVDYGTTPALGTTATRTGTATAHTVNLTGLQPGTRYYYQVRTATPTNSQSAIAPVQQFVTARATPQGRATVASTSLARRGGQIIATVNLQNTGGVPVQNLRITSATLNNVPTTTTLPVVIGTLNVSATASRALTFPNATGNVILRVSGTFTGGSFSYSRRLPAP